MNRSNALAAYLAVFLAMGLVGGIGSYFGPGLYQVLGCKLREPGSFLAYCFAPTYWDYEHGAYFYGLEPEAIASLKQADVLILGNSRAQVAFSTDVVRKYFEDRAIRYYVMAFSYGEGSVFAEALIKKYGLKPKAVIISSDPFFGNVSAVATKMTSPSTPLLDRISVRFEYEQKQLLDSFRRAVCASVPAACNAKYPAIYRDPQNGFWLWVDSFHPAEGERPMDTAVPLIADLAATKKAADSFFASTGIEKDCTILTAVPNGYDDAQSFARELGGLLGVKVTLPEIEGLTTIDISHMAWSSATRWSDAVLAEVGPLLEGCVAR